MKLLNKFFIALFGVFLLTSAGYSQVVYQHVDKESIYEFLDEMANLKLIDINSAVKPYSRKVIAEKLLEINSQVSVLNNRQKAELRFIVKEYRNEISPGNQVDYIGKDYFGLNKVPFGKRSKRADLFYFSDSLFRFSLNPVLGIQYSATDSGAVYHRWNGAELMGYVGSQLGIYASLRDNYLSRSVTGPDVLTQETGGGFKNPTYGFTNRQAVEYSEMRGGITLNGTWWNVGITKDHNVWGNNYHGANILSDRSPSYAQIRMAVKPAKWFELNYFHGWLSSKVIDTAATQSYGTGTTNTYVPKYMAANFLTITPVRHLHVSIGNSIIYSRHINAGYLIPLMFYKSLDHTYSTLGNSQMFVDISSRNLRKCHLFVTGFFDDFSFGRLFQKYNVTPWSFKAGGRVSDIAKNVSITAEYTRNYVYAYKHFNPETTFENTKYNLGHYLRDNAQEFYAAVDWKPLAKLNIRLEYCFANKGPDYPDNRELIDPVTGQPYLYLYSFQEYINWKKSEAGISGNYEIINDLVVKLHVSYSDIQDDIGIYTPGIFSGKQFTMTGMIAFGF